MAKPSYLLALAVLGFGVCAAMILENKPEDSPEATYTVEDPESTTSLKSEDYTDEEMEIDSTVKLDIVPTTDSVLEKKTQGPSRPATPKPGCPSYVSCPWVYPQPVTSGSVEMEEPQNTTGDHEPVVEYFGSNEGNETVLPEEDKNPQPSNGPSISATPKPQYPSYVPGPWIYPKPIGEMEESQNIASTTSQKPVVEYFGSNETVLPEEDKNPQPSNGPSISATPKPQYSSYLAGPWVYPRPIDEKLTTIAPPSYPFYTLQFRVPIFGHFRRPYPYDVERDPLPQLQLFHFYNAATKNVNKEESGDSTTTQDPDCPSFVSCPWIYPVPITDVPPVEQSSKDPTAEKHQTKINDSNNEPVTTQNSSLEGSTNFLSSKDPSLDNDISDVLGVDDFSDIVFLDPIDEKKQEISRANEILNAMIYGDSPLVFRNKNKPSVMII